MHAAPAARCAAPPARRAARAAAAAAPGPPPAPPRDYKVALVTGATSGIGFETAKALALRGDYYIVLGCRDAARGAAAKAALQAAAPGARGLEVAAFDLANLASVRAWAGRALDFGLPLDLLVNNAGVMACPESRTADGFEMQLGVNHLGHFLLTNMLLPLLTTPARPGRVVTVASAAHLAGALDFADLNYERRAYSAWGAYAQSKLANVMFASELARRAPALAASHSCHPGVVATELARHLLPPGGAAAAPAWQRPLLWAARQLALSPAEGARTSVMLATGEGAAAGAATGQYWDARRPAAASAAARDAAAAARLWDASAALVGLS